MKLIKINEKDNVAVALEETEKGGRNETLGITALEKIPAGHKIALADISANTEIIKYGAGIGYAKKDISKGMHVHTHNLCTSLRGKINYSFNPVDASVKKTEKIPRFMGFKRENGKTGVRNDIWIIPTVGCVNGIAKALEKTGNTLKKGSIGEVMAFTHPYGCSQLGNDQESTRKILSALAVHPNAGGVLVVGLGCENSGIDILKEYIGYYNPDRVKFLQTQDFNDEMEQGEKLLKKLISNAADDKREEVPVSELIIGLKCGGSDGFSGITANPAVGVFSDILISMDGSTILTEVPEMFGAEQILMNRSKDRRIFDDTVRLINDFKEYYENAGMPIYENPSPGNKEGGISTLEDKSLGCTQKSGSAEICGVLGYGDIIREKGLNLLSAPGNDLVAATALAAAGAQIVLFTTGRGTPFACPVPTVKISSNTALFNNKNNWIDFNAGCVLENKSINETAMELFDFVAETASGRLVKSEITGYYDMAIFKTGVTL